MLYCDSSSCDSDLFDATSSIFLISLNAFKKKGLISLISIKLKLSIYDIFEKKKKNRNHYILIL